MRGGLDHFLTVTYDRRLAQHQQSNSSAIGWDMTKVYLFLAISIEKELTGPRRGTSPLSAAQMMKSLRSFAQAVGIHQDFSMHSFRYGGAIAQALEGKRLTSIMQRAIWKRPSTAWRYMPLMQVISLGSKSQELVKCFLGKQFR